MRHGGIAKSSKNYNPSATPNSMFVKHVFTSSQGIPVTMAVLPPSNTEVSFSFFLHVAYCSYFNIFLH